MNYKISVAMCTYNGERYIEEQIQSILNQTLLPHEIVIIDDGSTDNTLNIAERLLRNSSLKFKIIINKKNLGVIKNFEKAINNTTGDIIFTCDQDDVWIENKVKKILEEFKKDDEISLVFTDAYLVDKNLSTLGLNLWEIVSFNSKKYTNKHDKLLKEMLKHNIMTGATMAFKKNTFNKSLPLNDLWIHDYWIGIITVILGGKVKALNEPLILYRQHENNVIGSSKKSLTSKVLNYITNNNSEVQRHGEKKLNMMGLLIKFINEKNYQVDNDYLYLINESNIFWEQKVHLKSQKKSTALKFVLLNLKNYNNYYTGIRGAIKDIIWILI